jgi:hypothetical protein
MQTKSTAADAAEIIECTLRDIGGALPIPANQLAVCCGFELAPHMATGAVPLTVHVPDADGLMWLHYDATQPPAVQARCIALACARYLVQRANKSPDAPLVEAVASGLCGACKPLVKATAALLVAFAVVAG